MALKVKLKTTRILPTSMYLPVKAAQVVRTHLQTMTKRVKVVLEPNAKTLVRFMPTMNVSPSKSASSLGKITKEDIADANVRSAPKIMVPRHLHQRHALSNEKVK